MPPFLGSQIDPFLTVLGLGEQDVIVLREPAAHFGQKSIPPLWVVVLEIVEDCCSATAIRLQARNGVSWGGLSDGRGVQSVSLHPAEPLEQGYGFIRLE